MISHIIKAKITLITCVFFLCFCTLVKSNSTTIVLKTWHNPPYYYADQKIDKGIIYDMLQELRRQCNLYNSTVDPELVGDIQILHNFSHGDILKEILKVLPNETLTVIASTTRALVQNKMQRRILLNTKPVAVLREGELLLLVKLWSGMKKVFIVVYFLLVITVFMAFVVWCLERRNNKHFPEDYARGLWCSVWFCFVAVTTVGFGDKIIKHFLSRLLCFCWIIFGIIMVSLITATLTREVDQEIDLRGEHIAVLNESIEMRMVKSQLKATPLPLKTYKGIFDAVRMKKARAAIIDKHVAAELSESALMSGLKIQNSLLKEIPVYMYISYFDKLRTCMRNNEHGLENIFDFVEQDLSTKYIPVLVTTKFFTRTMDELYNNDDGGLINAISVVAGSLVLLAFLSEAFQRISNSTFKKNRQQHKQVVEGTELCERINEMKALVARIESIVSETEKEDSQVKMDTLGSLKG